MEYEAKNLLTKQEYTRLFDHLNHTNNKPKTQINYYFETENFSLKNKGSALRIREKEGQFVVTLKQPKLDGILETHQTINLLTKNLWLNNQVTSVPEINPALEKLGIDYEQLKYWGQLKTVRLEIKVDDVLIVLDKSFYHDQIDYELEIEAESNQRASDELNHLLTKYQIKQRKTANKIERFFNTRQ